MGKFVKRGKPWNFGLTKDTSNVLKKAGELISSTKTQWDKERKEIFREKQRLNAIKYYKDHPEVKELRRQESLGVKQTDIAIERKSISGKQAWARLTSEQHKERTMKSGAGNKNKIRSQDLRKQISKSVSLYLNTSEGKANCRKGALAKALKYPDPRYYDTKPEIEMKRYLNELGIHYIFQYPVKSIEHCYVSDFYLPLYNIILEVDGIWSHGYPDGKEIDFIRTQELEEVGYRVLRFWEGQFDAKSVWNEI